MNDDIKPPQELTRYWRIERYGNPYGKPWMEWPAKEIIRMETFSNVYNLMSAKRQHKNLKEFKDAMGQKSFDQVLEIMDIINGK